MLVHPIFPDSVIISIAKHPCAKNNVRRTRFSSPSQHIVGQSELGDRTMMSRLSFFDHSRGHLKSSHHGISVEVIFLGCHDAVADLLAESRDSGNGIYESRKSLGLSPCSQVTQRKIHTALPDTRENLGRCPFHFKTPTTKPRATTAQWHL